jgi:hypothetical protein
MGQSRGITSDVFAYTLKNQSYKGLPHLLKRDLGIEIENRLTRRYLPTEGKGQHLQVNIYGWGRKNGKKTLNSAYQQVEVAEMFIKDSNKGEGR